MSLALTVAGRLDPLPLMQRMGTPPDPWQAESLAALRRREAMLCARQIGKSTTLVGRGTHRAGYWPDSMVGVLAPSLRQSCLLLRRIRRAFMAGVVPGVVPTNRALTTLTLSNGSEVVAWPGAHPEAIRGDVLDLLLVDEAGWITDEAWTATLPMLTMRKGDLLAASTPGAPEGLFFRLFNEPETAEDWHLTRATVDDCPRYTDRDKAELRRQLGEHAYAVEMECEWREAGGALFTSAEIAEMLGLPTIPEQLPGEEPLPDDDGPIVAVTSPAFTIGPLSLPSLADDLHTIRNERNRAS